MSSTGTRRAAAIVAGVLAASIALPGAAMAAGRGSGHGGGAGGQHGGGETTTANNLSVPTVFVPGTGAFAVTCGSGTPGALVMPSGAPLSGYPIDPGASYYVQGVNTWQAQCETAPAGTVDVTAAWGDNLTGGAALTTHHPIRVEIGLSTTGPAMNGFEVLKLDTDALDREAAYGTPAVASPTGGFVGQPTTFASPQVWDAAATLSITDDASGQAVFSGPAPAEINATGKVVYGYNLSVSSPGDYTIDFTAPSVAITGADAGNASGHTASLTIGVTGGGGGGGSGGSHGGGAGGGSHGGGSGH